MPAMRHQQVGLAADHRRFIDSAAFTFRAKSDAAPVSGKYRTEVVGWIAGEPHRLAPVGLLNPDIQIAGARAIARVGCQFPVRRNGPVFRQAGIVGETPKYRGAAFRRPRSEE